MGDILKLNSLVWAKLSGHPWWPGFIKSIKNPTTYEIEYFGDFSRSFLSNSKIKPFSEVKILSEKRNSRLSVSYAMAVRVFRGQSTIELEKQALETKYSTKSANQKMNNSQFEESNKSLADAIELSGLKKHFSCNPIIWTENAVHQNFKTSDILENNKNDQIFYDDDSVKSLNQSTKSPKGPHESIIELKPVLSRFHSRPLVLGEDDKIEDNFPPDEKSISIESEIDFELKQITSIEKKFEEVLNQISSSIVDFQKTHSNLIELQLEMLENEKILHRMFNTKIGSHLIKIQRTAFDIQKVDHKITPLYETIVLILRTIKKKLFLNFFKTGDSNQKTIYSSNEMENIINSAKINDLSKKIIFPVEERKKSFKIEHEKAIPMRKILKNPQRISRICKKLAKILYIKSRLIGLKKVQSEEISHEIESSIRKKCKNIEEYDTEIMKVHDSLRENYEKFVEQVSSAKVSLPMKSVIQKIKIFLLENCE